MAKTTFILRISRNIQDHQLELVFLQLRHRTLEQSVENPQRSPGTRDDMLEIFWVRLFRLKNRLNRISSKYLIPISQ
jgi:hypothetical protein